MFTWLLFVLYPNSGLDLEKGTPKLNVSLAWAQEHLEGIDPSWHKNANIAHAFDTWFLNLMSSSTPFTKDDSAQVAKPFVAN